MIDLHTHSIFRDGELIPSELVRRAKVMGYHALAITDHGDHSNIDFIIPRIVRVCQAVSEAFDIRLIPGIVALPPDQPVLTSQHFTPPLAMRSFSRLP